MEILNEFNGKGKFIVGGYVRDTLLNQNPNDIDYVIVGSSMEEMFSKGFKLVGKDFPVFLDLDGSEIALARKERKIAAGYSGFQWDVDNITLKEDLERRDLTINAMAMINESTLFDPFNGIEDLKNKILKHTSNKFSEDPVRVLRLARFYTRYNGEFTINEDTKKLVNSLRDDLYFLTKERVSLELMKVMKEENPQLFFICLKELNVLDILFPEIFEMIGCEHDNKYHKEGDVFNHTMKVLAEISKITQDITTRIGALYHDIGKSYAKKTYGDFHNHDNDELIDLKLFDLKTKYRFGKDIYSIISIGAKHHHTLHKLLKMTPRKVVKHFMSNSFAKNKNDLIRLFEIAQADSFGRLVEENGKIYEGKELSDYDNNFKNFIINTFIKQKSVSAKNFLLENPEASIDSIKQYIHKTRINIYIKDLEEFKEKRV